MTIVSFFTRQPKYMEQAHRLRLSCIRANMPAMIAQLESNGDWLAACNQKPRFLLKMLCEVRGPILWCDSDCEILRPFLDSAFVGRDFGIFNWRADARGQRQYGGTPDQLLSASGVLFLDYTAPAIELLIQWIDACDDDPATVDDQVLDRVWSRRERPPVKSIWLPREANWMTGHWGEPKQDCVIRHDFIPGVGHVRRVSVT